MAEIIESIEETSFTINPEKKRADSYDGFVITTSLRKVVAGISNYQDCCENWGYMTTLDSSSDFIGAELLDIKITNAALETAIVPVNYYESGTAIFITFETSKGDFQLVVYNEHNGYYSHDVVVQSNQLNFKESL